jgi:hypothetical protein
MRDLELKGITKVGAIRTGLIDSRDQKKSDGHNEPSTNLVQLSRQSRPANSG